jgi:hypothetical protein
MADNDAQAPAGLLDGIGRNITILGTIVAGIVGINTALTTCSNDTISRHQTFRQAVDGEEQYWRSLYSDYLGAFGKDITPPEREARLLALRVLAQREVPTFDEYSFGLLGDKAAQNAARSRLESMKSQLIEALSRQDSSTPAVAEKQQNQTFEAAVQTAIPSPVKTAEAAATMPSPIISTPIPSSGVIYQTQTLAAGNQLGWDLDVFWCGGGDSAWESANYQSGLDAARALAVLSSGNKEVGGEKIGRIRLVMLPEQRQGGDYPARGFGNEIRPDSSEVRMAAAVLSVITNGKSYKVSVNPPPPSAYYLSLFSCTAGAAPAGRPRPNR